MQLVSYVLIKSDKSLFVKGYLNLTFNDVNYNRNMPYLSIID